MIADILPAGVVAAEAFDDSVPVRLFPAEEDVIRRAVDKRRQEFATVRRCAREALGVLGYPPAPLLPGERGAPLWPSGVVGSLTHCAGYRAAAVASAGHMWTIGIDAEPDEPLPSGVLGTIALWQEQEAVQRLGRTSPGPHWDRLLFSAKEAVYKAWFPLTRRWLGFDEAAVAIDPTTGSFHASLLVPLESGGRRLTGFNGRYAVERGLVITAVTVAAAGCAGQTPLVGSTDR